ncbi:unnamed protein product, partial [Prorocentrum cordatum]
MSGPAGACGQREVVDFLARCADCEEEFGPDSSLCAGLREPSSELVVPEAVQPQVAGDPEQRGLRTYVADAGLPLLHPPVREGRVLYLSGEFPEHPVVVRLALHRNGFASEPLGPLEGAPAHPGAAAVARLSVCWSPFALVQACRLHTVEADRALGGGVRLFKISVFHHGVTHAFATQGPAADEERARWVADIARAIRLLTQSLFPAFTLRAYPLEGASWTAMRLLAGYLLLCDTWGVALVYAELHAFWDGVAMFYAYQ